MTQPSAIRVDLHCHSACSDGTLSPEQLAHALLKAGVGFAALTDHNTTDGLEPFREILEARGVRVVSGLELDARLPSGGVHLLAFGFDPHHTRLRRALRAVRHPHWDHAIRGWWPAGLRRLHAPVPLALGPATGALHADDAIALLHEAGARVFLAHPMAGVKDVTELESLLDQLQPLGLDGVEADYKAHDEETRQCLHEVAARRGLLCSGGSDFHGPSSALGSQEPGLDLPEASWQHLSRAMGWSGEAFLHRGGHRAATPSGPGWRRAFVLHIGLPAALAGLLFVGAIFGLLLPAMEAQLLERKQEMIRELTRTATSMLREYADEVEAGRMSLEAAQSEAVERVRKLRYGPEGKDYFWITDMTPRMVMHPWRPDLEGRDLRDFRDPSGRLIFVAFVDAVRQRDMGYVNYHWQWKDDPRQISPKLSHVQAFRPWGWVLGTGIYTEDLKAEVAKVRERLVMVSLGIVVATALLMSLVLKRGAALEKRRARAELELREAGAKYRALVEASTEGTIVVMDGRCAYANSPMERMLGEDPGALSGRGLRELLTGEADPRREDLETLLEGGEGAQPLEISLPRRDGHRVEVVISASAMAVDGRPATILVVRDVSGTKRLADTLQRSRVHYRKLTRSIQMGVFRSAWHRSALLLEANPALRRLLGLPEDGDLGKVDWLECVADRQQRDHLRERLEREESVDCQRLALRRVDGGLVEVRLFAVLVREEDQPLCDGVMEDITVQTRGEAEREELIRQLQTSLFYLQEPILPALHPAPVLTPEQPIIEAAARMGAADASALVVTTQEGGLLGLVTDRDFRARVTAVGLDRSRPVREIMSAPVATISSHALVHEAILLMQERGIGHLAVLDDSGSLMGVLRDRHLIHFRHYSSVIMAQSIRQAANPQEIRAALRRLPRLVHALLESGARVRAVNRVITGAADAAVERLLALALVELGPAPCPFAFLVMGSQGRQEQGLLTDQDNGIIYEDPPAGREVERAAWFLRLGERLSRDLAEAGYRECPGGVMARNARWNQSLSGWTTQFRRWIRTSDSQELLDLNIAFDFRCVGGDASLARELRRRVFEEIQAHAPFLLLLAQNALLAKPPVGFGGRIVVQAGQGGQKGLNLKEALLPVVNHGRLYALRHQVEECHTLDRLGRLHELGRLAQETWEELLPDYEAVMRMRLEHQARALLEGREADNVVSPGAWTALDEAMLKRLFAVVQDLRKKISYDFLGMA